MEVGRLNFQKGKIMKRFTVEELDNFEGWSFYKKAKDEYGITFIAIKLDSLPDTYAIFRNQTNEPESFWWLEKFYTQYEVERWIAYWTRFNK